MERIYMIGLEKQHDQSKAEFDFRVNMIPLRVFFGEKDGKRYGIIAGIGGSRHRVIGHRGTRSHLWYDVYYRVNYPTKELGNAAYKRVKALFKDLDRIYECRYDSFDSDIVYDDVVKALSPT